MLIIGDNDHLRLWSFQFDSGEGITREMPLAHGPRVHLRDGAVRIHLRFSRPDDRLTHGESIIPWLPAKQESLQTILQTRFPTPAGLPS